MSEDVMHPDEIAKQVQRTREYIKARYGGEIPAVITGFYHYADGADVTFPREEPEQ